MSVSTPGIFVRSVFGGATRQTSQKAAAAGFAQIFTTMVAKQMRESMVGSQHGPMGLGGGATGDIYGAFIDQALGKALAGSKSMGGLTKMIDRELSGPRHLAGVSSNGSGPEQIASSPRPIVQSSTTAGVTNTVLPEYTGVTRPNDRRGPLLLPPTPELSAPVLLTPPSEG